MNEDEILLSVNNLSHSFYINKNMSFKVLNDVSFDIKKREIFGLVGESGSGKSTLAKCVMNVITPEDGDIFFKGINILNRKEFDANKKMLQASRQLIFQDSDSSLDPKMKVCDIISEPLVIHRIAPPRGSMRAEAEFQMKYVGLDSSYLDRYPGELSGGMRQRVAIARALVTEPELLVADEPIASLDVSIQAQIINLFRHLQKEHGFSFLFIAHDLAMVEYLCDRVGVLYRGKLVEIASAKEIFSSPLHPYTKALISAMPVPDPLVERNRRLADFSDKDFCLDGELKEVSCGHFVLKKGEEKL